MDNNYKKNDFGFNKTLELFILEWIKILATLVKTFGRTDIGNEFKIDSVSGKGVIYI